MKKASIENIKDAVPSLIENLGKYLKGVVKIEAQKENIENISGTIGFFVRLFGKPLIDEYFKKLSQSKLEQNGFNTYLKAAFSQAYKSLENIKATELTNSDLHAVTIGVEKSTMETITKLEKAITILVFQPKYHPAIVFVKELIIKTFASLNIAEPVIQQFQKDFNNGIEESVVSEFGDDYELHKKSVEKYWFEENETKMLFDIINQNKIGFSEDEELKYEESFGFWQPTYKGPSIDSDEYFPPTKEPIDKIEKTLSKTESLIEDYFAKNPESHLEKILFIIADFGKGKSTFIKNYAAQLAKTYLNTAEGDVPIYFNLRNYARYFPDNSLGIIDDFLQSKYAIKINSEYFIKKKYCFLIDSLDESGDLSNTSIEKVISSVKRIQNLDKTKYRTNKIIITSRPFDSNLYNLISGNKPYELEIEKHTVGHYISLYGFKKNQFNDWIFNSLSDIKINSNINSSDHIIKNILSAIAQGKEIDFYEMLLQNQTLSVSELRRPIFAYMIFKLITNNINVTKTGKIGIYLSFLNLLSKEAKYIYDPNYQISLLEQIEARNILHLTAALWSYEKQNGKQGILKKADLCRIIEKENSNESDDKILERYKNSHINQIEFLSHSYFGEQNNVLHFQHQSFAEILLAEYYIKVIIKFALDRNYKLEEAISKLMLGIPTSQTILFFSEILVLLRETVSNDPTEDIYEKRKLIFPLLASISIDTNNPSLYSDQLFYRWYNKGNITKDTTEIPEVLISEWCINQQTISVISNLCKQVIESDSILILSKSMAITNLFDNELTLLKNKSFESSMFIHKFLCLVVGNKLDLDKSFNFIRSIDTNVILELLKVKLGEGPSLFKEQFKGCSIVYDPMKANSSMIGDLNLSDYDFSYFEFSNLIFFDCRFLNCNFTNTIFKDTIFYDCDFEKSNLNKAIIQKLFFPISTSFGRRMNVPKNLLKKISEKYFSDKNQKFVNHTFSIFHNIYGYELTTKIVIESEDDLQTIMSIYDFFFSYGIKGEFFNINDILLNFQFDREYKKEGKTKMTSLLKNLH